MATIKRFEEIRAWQEARELSCLWIAKGSAAEVQSQLYVSKDVGYISDSDFEQIYSKAEGRIVLIDRFIQSLRTSPITGERYK